MKKTSKIASETFFDQETVEEWKRRNMFKDIECFKACILNTEWRNNLLIKQCCALPSRIRTHARTQISVSYLSSNSSKNAANLLCISHSWPI